MNINKKAHSLYQSMDRWILLYRRIHECDHNTAHDALDEMADKLTGAAADQSTPQFQEAVDASYDEMKAKHPKTVQVEAMVMTSQGKIDRLLVTPIPEPSLHHPSPRPTSDMSIGALRGGPLLELSYGKQEPRRQFGKAEFGGPAEVVVPDNAPIGGPILDTGTDPLAFADEAKHPAIEPTKLPMIDTADEARKKAEDAIELNTGFLINTKHPTDHPSVVKAREVIAAARTFLVMLGGVEERSKERKTLSLPRK